MRKKILWFHPKIRDYRKILFERIYNKHDVLFAFQKEYEPVQHDFNHKIVGELSLITILKLRKEIKQADVIISSFIWRSKWIILLSTLVNKKIIIWEERWNWKGATLKKSIKIFLSKKLLPFINAFFVMGNIQKNGLIKKSVNQNKIFVANEYTGNIYHITPQSPVAHIFDENKKNLIYFGRFTEFKGIKYLIKSMTVIQNVYYRDDFLLNIIGYGELKNDLIKMVKSLNLANVKIYDPIFKDEEKSFLFNSSYLAIVPSIIDSNGLTEGGPIVIPEYLSAGLPVIVTDAVGSTMQFVKDNINGKIVKQKDADAIAEAILSLDKLIDDKKITKKSVFDTFEEIPGFENQAKVLEKAIQYVSQK